MDNLKTIVEIIAGILGIFATLGIAAALVSQNSVSQTLLTHAEKEKKKILEGLIVSLLFAAIVFAIGSFSCLTINGLKRESVETTAEAAESVDEAQSENDNNDAYINEDSNADNNANSIVPSLVILATLIVPVIVCIWRYRVERRKIEYKNKCTLNRYFEIGSFIYLLLLVLLGVGFAAAKLKIGGFLIVGGILSLLFGFFFVLLLSEFIPEYQGGKATIRTLFNNEIVYLFEMKDNCVVAGDNPYFSRCDKYFLISMDKISRPLVSAQNEKDVFLLKDNISVKNHLERTKNELLRCVVMDCVEKGIPINEDSKLEVEGTKVISTHTINYTVTNGDDGITKTMSICDHSLDEWGGNVILM